MEDKLTKNKAANIILSAILTFFMPGLGQIACGKIKRGVAVYIFSLIFFIAAAFVAIQPIPMFNIIAAGLIFISVFLFTLIDSILIAKNPDNTLKLKPLIGYSILVIASIVNSSLVQPAISKTIKAKYIQAFHIPSISMMPSLLIGDHLLVNKQTYKKNSPKRGDIIIFDFPEDTSKTFIRRVVGIGGDVIEIRNKQLYINGKQYSENYVMYADSKSLPKNSHPIDDYGPTAIPEDSFFVLGDNRNSSYDSRYWGFLTADKIKGKAATIYWSWDKANNRVRWDRIGKLIN
jgi:signal peptidase I